MKVTYQGGLRCEAVHTPSGNKLQTDAPVDNHGRGETFSPTDLLATSLATCMSTMMGIVAERKKVSLEGMRIIVKKQMSSDNPRRIDQIDLEFFMPISENHPERKLLQSTILGCPVHHSLHPDIKMPVTWHWDA